MSNGDSSATPRVQTRKPMRDETNTHLHIESVGDLTKREVFAVAAMQGLCASPHNLVSDDGAYKEVAINARLMADALLGELENKEK